MNSPPLELEARVAALERSLRRTRTVALLAPLAVLVVIGSLAAAPPGIQDQVRTRQLAVVDDAGRVRVLLAQDPRDTQRRSRGAGLTLFDSTGTERGGFTTLDDGTVLIGMDAPRGVGSPMGDRLALAVGPDGAADVMLLDNETKAVAKLHSAGDGSGGVQVFRWDLKAKKVQVRTVVYGGDQLTTVPLE